MSHDQPRWAPDEMPEVAYDPDNEMLPFDKRWAAAQMKNGAYAIVIEETFDPETGQALTVAMAPAGEFAQYIAYFHNMLLKGSQLLSVSVDEVLKGYATGTPPAPPETGGYL